MKDTVKVIVLGDSIDGVAVLGRAIEMAAKFPGLALVLPRSAEQMRLRFRAIEPEVCRGL